MYFQVLLAILVGICAGILTGLTPGIHVNLLSLIVVNLSGSLLKFTSPLMLGVFIVSMAVTHTFLDIVPSIFLGAPDENTALAVLPGHRLLLRGMGFEAVKLATIGSLLCLCFTVALIPVLIPFVPLTYTAIEPYIGWALALAVVFMVLREKGMNKKFWAVVVFFLSGIMGMVVLGMPELEDPLFGMLSGLFGISVLIFSIFEKVEVPKQRITEMIKIGKKNLAKTILTGTFSGSLVALFPGLGSAQAAVLGSQMIRSMGMYSFIVLVGGINTVNFVFSLVALLTLRKARNGAVLAVMEILKSISLNEALVFLCAALIAGGIATFLAMGIARIFVEFINKINYRLFSIFVILFITALVFYFSSWIGLLVLFVSTSIGMIPSFAGVKKSFAMGCLLLPVILYFIL